MTEPYAALSIEQVARYPRPGTTVPARLGFTPDGTGVTYLYSAEGTLVRSLWRFDVATGERTLLAGPGAAATDERELSRDEELRRERLRLRELGVTDYQFARQAPVPVLLVSGGGRLSVGIDGGELREVAGCDGALDPQLSPDGSKLAFVRGGELWVTGVPGGTPRQLTHGAEDGLTHGLAEFIAQEELDRDRGFWWSPDGREIAFIEADERHIPVYPIVYQGRDTVDVENHRYPFAGARNAVVRLGVVSVDGGEPRWLDALDDPDAYIARAGWRPDGVIACQVLSRDQQDLWLYAFEDGRRAEILHEHGEPWLNLGHETRFLESGEFTWGSERTGYRHLYLYANDGTLIRPLTEGDWVVTRLVEVDQRERVAYFTATKDGPAERHLYAVSLDGGPVRRLTDAGGWNDGIVSRDGATIVEVASSLAQAPVVRVRDRSGEPSTPIVDTPPPSANALGLVPPVLLTLPAADGTPLDAALYEPAGREPGRTYPLVVSVYGGPHAQRVADEWSLTVDLRAQRLAQRGIAVLKVDNRGSANRGIAFEAPLHLRMGFAEIDDQAAAVRALAAQHDWIDLERVGIYGWSYGGYATLMAMCRYPDLFRVGVAGAPVTHWDGYDTAYTERYMSTPQKNPDGYREGAVMAHIEHLRGRLMVVHGMIDENVHFRHTARLLVALAAHQKSCELLAFPEERHMPRDAAGLEYQERRVIAFLEQLLEGE